MSFNNSRLVFTVGHENEAPCSKLQDILAKTNKNSLLQYYLPLNKVNYVF
jgi:hypothetical protein